MRYDFFVYLCFEMEWFDAALFHSNCAEALFHIVKRKPHTIPEHNEDTNTCTYVWNGRSVAVWIEYEMNHLRALCLPLESVAVPVMKREKKLLMKEWKECIWMRMYTSAEKQWDAHSKANIWCWIRLNIEITRTALLFFFLLSIRCLYKVANRWWYLEHLTCECARIKCSWCAFISLYHSIVRIFVICLYKFMVFAYWYAEIVGIYRKKSRNGENSISTNQPNSRNLHTCKPLPSYIFYRYFIQFFFYWCSRHLIICDSSINIPVTL